MVQTIFIPFLNSLQGLQLPLLLPGNLSLIMRSKLQPILLLQTSTMKYQPGKNNSSTIYSLPTMQEVRRLQIATITNFKKSFDNS